jgi:hypothetical protein
VHKEDVQHEENQLNLDQAHEKLKNKKAPTKTLSDAHSEDKNALESQKVYCKRCSKNNTFARGKMKKDRKI